METSIDKFYSNVSEHFLPKGEKDIKAGGLEIYSILNNGISLDICRGIFLKSLAIMMMSDTFTKERLIKHLEHSKTIGYFDDQQIEQYYKYLISVRVAAVKKKSPSSIKRNGAEYYLLKKSSISVKVLVFLLSLFRKNSGVKKIDPIDIPSTKNIPLSIVKKSIEDYSTFTDFLKNTGVEIDDYENKASINEFVILRLAILNFLLSTKLGDYESNLIMDKLVPNTFVCLFNIIAESGYSGSENTFFSECQSVYNKRQSLYSIICIEKGILSPEAITVLSCALSDVLNHYHKELVQEDIYVCVKLNMQGIISSTLKTAKDL